MLVLFIKLSAHQNPELGRYVNIYKNISFTLTPYIDFFDEKIDKMDLK